MITFIKEVMQQNMCPMYIPVNMGERIDVDSVLIVGMTSITLLYSLIVFRIGAEYAESLDVSDQAKDTASIEKSITMTEIYASKILEDLRKYNSSEEDADVEDDHEADDNTQDNVSNIFEFVKLE